MRVLVLHGPNLNLLGNREPDVYGSETLADVDQVIMTAANDLGIDVLCAQHNGEGELIDALHAARVGYDGVVINPGAYSHYSYAIADAIAAIGIPVVEVHLSNIAGREKFRRRHVTSRACRGSVAGFGAFSYVLGLRALAEMLDK
ncbi:MAG: type II 3-dehydroquinate dehydratase [Candidatus Tumulicola sp.]